MYQKELCVWHYGKLLMGLSPPAMAKWFLSVMEFSKAVQVYDDDYSTHAIGLSLYIRTVPVCFVCCSRLLQRQW